ncbi:MAG: TlpA disulfide reductase family protein, partial [bacterium]
MDWKLFRPGALIFAALLIAASIAVSAPRAAESAPVFNKLLIAPEGSAPPKDFSYPNLAGKNRRLSEFRGKVVLLTFFATWCPLCNVEMPKLVRIHEKYKNRGLTVVAVSIDRTPASFVKRWVESRKLTYPVLHDQKFRSRLRHNVRNVPTIYVLDRDLQLAAWTVGQVNWEGKKATALIEKL